MESIEKVAAGTGKFRDLRILFYYLKVDIWFSAFPTAMSGTCGLVHNSKYY